MDGYIPTIFHKSDQANSKVTPGERELYIIRNPQPSHTQSSATGPSTSGSSTATPGDKRDKLLFFVDTKTAPKAYQFTAGEGAFYTVLLKLKKNA